MRVLWICNIVLNDFTEEFHIKKSPTGSWMDALLDELEKEEGLEIGLCFPIYDEERMKPASFLHGHKFYTFHGKSFTSDAAYRAKMHADFIRAFEDFHPDVVNIWGTENDHATESFSACEELGMADRVLIRLQGHMRSIADHFLIGIPEKYLSVHSEEHPDLPEQQRRLSFGAMQEKALLCRVKYISDKSQCGRFYAKRYAPEAEFTYCDNLLRETFYQHAGSWSAHRCIPHTIFVGAGRSAWKGLHVLLLAIALVKRSFPDMLLKVASTNVFEKDVVPRDGYVQYVLDLINEFNLEKNVEFIGPLDADQMVQEYQKANVSVIPSLEENKANVICEAMMIGTPTIASFVGGNVDAIRHGVDGFLFPIGNETMLAGYICDIFSDAGLANRISKAAVETSLQRHDKEKIKKTYCELYHKIAQNAKGR